MDINSLPADLRHAVEFHGHFCPGLLIGYRAVKALQAKMGLTRSEDEEIVAIAENDSCSVDAFQALLSTTFGKGNLKWLDHGKQAFTVHDRKTGRAMRAVFTGDKLRRFKPDGSMDREAYTLALLSAPDDEILSISDVATPPPDEAKIEGSVACAGCGETTQQSRTVQIGGRVLCKACAAKEGAAS